MGTRFEIHIPAARDAEVVAKQERPAPVLREQGRMLVMDDDELLREVLRQMGISMGFEVLVADRGEDAVRLYADELDRNRPFDLVVMDLTVPGGMGGVAAVKEVLALDENARVVVASGYSNDPVMANFRDYGFKAALVKPFDFDAVRWVVGELLGESPSV